MIGSAMVGIKFGSPFPLGVSTRQIRCNVKGAARNLFAKSCHWWVWNVCTLIIALNCMALQSLDSVRSFGERCDHFAFHSHQALHFACECVSRMFAACVEHSCSVGDMWRANYNSELRLDYFWVLLMGCWGMGFDGLHRLTLAQPTTS